MHPKTIRGIKLSLAALTVGTCLQVVSPQGCIGVLQQNIEAALRTNSVIGPELYQAFIYPFLVALRG